jgi:hypothetical protein
MGFFRSLWRSKQFGGYVKYFGLEKWYAALTEQQRALLRRVEPEIETAEISYTSQTAGEFVSRCATAVAEYDVDFAEQLFKRALDLEHDPVKRHFTLMAFANFYRRQVKSAEKWHEVVREDIELMPAFAGAWAKEFNDLPGYPAVEDMLRVLRGRGDLPEAIAICKRAQKLGIAGNWEEQIGDLQRRIEDG